MPKTQTTVIGNLTRDPEVRHLPDGAILTTITVAENTRRRENGVGEWHDHRTTFWGVTCWRRLAVYVAGSLKKGDRVVVVGETYLDQWTGSDGHTRRSLKLEPVTVAVDLSRAPVQVTRVDPVNGAVHHPAAAAASPGWTAGAEVPDSPPAEEEPDEDPVEPDDRSRPHGPHHPHGAPDPAAPQGTHDPAARVGPGPSGGGDGGRSGDAARSGPLVVVPASGA